MKCFTKKYQALSDELEEVLSRSLSADCPDLIDIGERFTAQVRLKMMQGLIPPLGHMPPLSEERLLTVDEASRKLGMTKDYLYRNADRLPFTIRLAPRQLRFSLQGIERYIRQRKSRPAS